MSYICDLSSETTIVLSCVFLSRVVTVTLSETVLLACCKCSFIDDNCRMRFFISLATDSREMGRYELPVWYIMSGFIDRFKREKRQVVVFYLGVVKYYWRTEPNIGPSMVW